MIKALILHINRRNTNFLQHRHKVPDIMHRHRLVITAGRHIKIDSAFAVMDIVDRQLGIVHFIRPICLAIREGVQ